MIFSRQQRSGAGRHTPGRHTAGGNDATGRDAAAPRGSAANAPTTGPFDAADAPDDGIPRLDLGSLLIPALDGVELRVQADPNGQIQQIMLVDGDSSLHLGAFAAPRSDGVWDEIRAEIMASLAADGGSATEIDGEYGPQLRAYVANGANAAELRYVGIDGPRWFVRAVFQGAAAADPAASPSLALVLAGLVVVRGSQAMPVREALPLRLPKEMLEQMQSQQGGEAAQGHNGSGPGINGANGSPGARLPRG